MTTDNDQAAVEAIQRAIDDEIELGDEHGDRFDKARAVLAAIRAGQVPGVFVDDTPATDDHRNKPGWLKAERDRLHAEVERLKEEKEHRNTDIYHKGRADAEREATARADKATAERDRLAGLLRESNGELEEQWSRTTDGHNSRRIREVMDRNDAALAEIGGGK